MSATTSRRASFTQRLAPLAIGMSACLTAPLGASAASKAQALVASGSLAKGAKPLEAENLNYYVSSSGASITPVSNSVGAARVNTSLVNYYVDPSPMRQDPVVAPATRSKTILGRMLNRDYATPAATVIASASQAQGMGRVAASRWGGMVQTGQASWYGADFHGGKTANGERYDMESMTAAHRTLPFGTLVKVTNLGNMRECIVRINNRGPFSKGRILDMSKAAARELGMVSRGVARVNLTVLGRQAN